MFPRVFSPPAKSFFLLGPRGTGKTTWLGSRFPKAVRYDLLNHSEFLRLSRDPEAFRREVEALSRPATVIVDEVQKLPALLDDVHHFLARPGNDHRFVLTGSSARKLRRSGANLLAGRAANRYFFPLVYEEHRRIDRLEEILKFGTLPEILNDENENERIDFLEAYAVNYLRQEIQQETLTRDVESFSRFLTVAGLMNGQLSNIAGTSRDAGVARTTVSQYYTVLEDTLIGFWLRSWQPKLRVKEVEHPKFYFFDPGVARVCAGKHRRPVDDVERGFLFETCLLNEFRVWNQVHGWGATLHFWRTPANIEIDLIVGLPDETRAAFEFKCSSRWKPQFSKGLHEMVDRGLVSAAFGVYTGSRALKDRKIRVLPVKDLCSLLAADRIF